MSLSGMMRDQVTLIKQNGERREGIRASVQREKVFIKDASLIIEPGDCIERLASNGLRELFEVVDPVFYEDTGGIPAHYQITVRRATGRQEPPQPQVTGSAAQPGLHPWGVIEELFFPTGSEHDAYVRLREIIQSAKSSVTVVDPYVDTSILTVLGTSQACLDIRILTHKLAADFSLESQKFMQQHKPKSFEVRRTREFHDRFIILDSSRCYHVGASIKDAGLRAFMVSQVQDPENVRALLKQVENSWVVAS